MRRAAGLFALAFTLVIGGLLAFTSPPRLLAYYDRAAGGGAGARQVADGLAFGTQGQTLDIWAPAEAPQGKLPVVIFWYGGGWAKGDRAAYAFAGRALAREGFLVVIPDYRKVPDVLFPAFLDDGAEAAAWVQGNIAQHGGDPARIAFMGHSAGAYQAVMLALDSKRLVAAGVDPANVRAAVGLSGPYDFHPFDSPRSRRSASGRARMRRSRSPLPAPTRRLCCWSHRTVTPPCARKTPTTSRQSCALWALRWRWRTTARSITRRL